MTTPAAQPTEYDYGPVISASQLLDLAAKADALGAKLYADAYRIVARRLQLLAEDSAAQPAAG